LRSPAEPCETSWWTPPARGWSGVGAPPISRPPRYRWLPTSAADLIALHEALEILAQRNESLGMLRDLGAAEDAIGLGLEGYGRLRLLEGRESAADSLLREALAIAQKHYTEAL